MAVARGEVGPLSSWLPRRHLTRHEEVWLDQGSPEPLLASVCSELDFRLAEETNSTVFSPFCWSFVG